MAHDSDGEVVVVTGASAGAADAARRIDGGPVGPRPWAA